MKIKYRDVGHYFDENTDDFYRSWNESHVHFGIFLAHEPYETPVPIAALIRMIDTVCLDLQCNSGDLVLDAGCGVGGTAFYIAKKYNCRVIGLNISQRQIEIAKSQAIKLGLSSQVSFQYADCCHQLSFPDNSIDAIINIESACHYNDINSFLKECYRVLKPSKCLAAVDWMTKNNISSFEYTTYIKPVIDNWFLSGLRSLEEYKLILHASEFNILYASYLKDVERNIEYIKNAKNHMFKNCPGPMHTEKQHMWYEQFSTLVHAWESKHFALGHYLARKD